MTNVLDSGIGSLWYVKQTSGKGTKGLGSDATVTAAKVKWEDGGLSPKPVDGEEEYIDGNRIGSPSMWRDSILGDLGDITIQAQPDTGPLFLAQFLGKDTVTGSVDPWTHTITSAGTTGAFGTWFQKTGATVGPQKEAYWDTKIGKLVMNASDKQNPMHMVLSILGLQLEIFGTDPTKAENAEDPYYWNETSGAVEVDGLVTGDVEEEVLELDTGMEAWSGNDIKPAQLIEKKGTIVRAIHAIFTDATLKKFNKAIFGSEAPAESTTPIKTVFYAAMKTKYEKSASRKVTFESPRVQCDLKDMSLAAQREGGAVPIQFGGKALKSGAEPALTVVALNASATSVA